MKILITGSSGFIGTALCQTLNQASHDIYITGKKDENSPCEPCTYLGHEFHNLDWDNLDVDALFHCASCTDTMVHDKNYMMQVNYDWAKKLITDAVSHGVKNIVYSSSAAVYGRYSMDEYGDVIPFKETSEKKPLNVYGESKTLLDEFAMDYAEQKGVKIVGLRYSNVYGGLLEEHKGKCASMVWQLYKKMYRYQPVLFKFGEQARDFVYIADVVNANLLAMAYDKSDIFNIGAGYIWTFNTIVDLVNDILNKSWDVNYIDHPFPQYYQDYNRIDISKAVNNLDYQPRYMLEDGIQAIHEDFLETNTNLDKQNERNII